MPRRRRNIITVVVAAATATVNGKEASCSYLGEREHVLHCHAPTFQ